MNKLEKWIFDSIDLQTPMKKHLKLYNSNLIPFKAQGYYLCHFTDKNGYKWTEFLKPNKHGYIINKFGQIFDIDYDKDSFHIINTYKVV